MYDMMKKQNFGVEIELTGITREQAANVIATYFGTQARYLGTYYKTYGATDRKGRTWKAMSDGSILTERKSASHGRVSAGTAFSCEVVTPVLQYEDMDDLQNIIRALREAGAIANSSCGIHVHVDGKNHTPASLTRLMNFAIGRQELKIFLGTSRDIRVLELYKRLKGRIPMAECAKWLSEDLNIRKTFSAAKRWSLPPEKLMRYLDSNVGCAQYGGVQSMDSALRFWEDYLTAAEAMGYQLHRENVLLPRNLGTAHNEATGQHRARLEQERRTEQERREAQRLIDQRERDLLMAETYAKRKVKLEKKYGFAMDGYVIRAPMDKDEILAEGRKLQHCVGGYADRHMSGAVTILFMRKAQKPNEPWLTIEMNGNSLVQIHGFRNEGMYTTKGTFAPNPREVYREFLDTWLDWLAKGSKRDKEGNPKLPRKKKGAAA